MEFQLDQSKIDEIKSLGIMINWTFLDIGFNSETPFSRQLSTTDILDYAIDQLAHHNADELVLTLAIEDIQNFYEIDTILKKLADKENADRCLELSKWKVYYLFCNLQKEENYIDGICKLADIWETVGSYEERSTFIQGVGNFLDPQSFYTKENYDVLFAKSILLYRNLLSKVIENQSAQNYNSGSD